MPEKISRFDIFPDAHFGFGIRWRKSMFYTGWDFSFAFPGFCVIVSTGAAEKGLDVPELPKAEEA